MREVVGRPVPGPRGTERAGGQGRPGPQAKAGLQRTAVEWGFRLLAGRPAASEEEFAAFQAMPDIDSLRRAFTNTAEFHAFFDSVLTGQPSWTLPLFLLRPPTVEGLAWTFEPPTLEHPVSQLCTASQFADPAFLEIVGAMGLRAAPSRSQWEQAWIVSVLATAGLVAPGRAGLALACGRERIASLLASRGVQVTATDGQEREARAAEHRRLELFYPEIIPIADFDQLVRFMRLDTRDVGRVSPAGFDFCWSLGVPERLGSVQAAVEFLEASLAPLKPGGLAVHSFAFNLTSETVTWEMPDLVMLRRPDIEAMAARLRQKGHTLLPLNTHPGLLPEDEMVKTDQVGPPGLRQRHGVVVSTSFGLAIRKAA
ncbi:hypothetical protein [Falsiroseomonas sp. HW251]|uniref:hypothetical protein n=1 Tax=Falsiroseomonas sp. HW251 TaxID=3390998 RepID=UPI003D31F848